MDKKEPLRVYFQEELSRMDLLSSIACQSRGLPRQTLSYASWSGYPYKPEVQFAISYTHDSFLLQYDVKENFMRAANGRTNEPVFEDSCVEFFISFDNGTTYYNLEFNCIGTVLGCFGKRREDRELLPAKILDKIQSQVIIRRERDAGLANWELTVVIPFEVFMYDSLSSLQGRRCKANFYKCGDCLPEPHFLSWSEIKSNKPDFHLPEYFGALHFI